MKQQERITWSEEYVRKKIEERIRDCYKSQAIRDQINEDSINRAYRRYLGRPDASLNQCDGCMNGLTVKNGMHLDSNDRPIMVCTKKRYQGHEME